MFAIRVMKIEEVKNIASRCCSVQKEALSSTRREKNDAQRSVILAPAQAAIKKTRA